MFIVQPPTRRPPGGEVMPVTRVSLASLLACCVAAAILGGASHGEEPDAATMRRLIGDLNAGSRAIRETAEQRLLEAGAAALPAISAARGAARGEAAFRLDGIQRAIEERAAVAAVEQGLATLAVTVLRVEPIRAPVRAARVVLRAAWRPPLKPLVIRMPMADVVAEGPAGEAMTIAQRQAVVEPALSPGETTVELPLRLLQPEHPLDTVAVLRGTLRLWLAGRPHDFAFPLDGTDPRVQTVAEASVALEQAAVREGRLLVTARVSYDAPSEALASHRTWLTHHPLEVVAADGRSLERVAQTPTDRSERGLTATAEFLLPAGTSTMPTGLRACWRLPMAIHETPFDFILRDVPLGGSPR
jgi:hypothetical protein